MTVVAYDGKYLVADGRCTIGGSTLVSDSFPKIHEFWNSGLGNCVIGLAGCLDLQVPYLKHLKINGLEPMDDYIGKDDEGGPLKMRGILLTGHGEAFEVSSEGGCFALEGIVIAIGSGQDIAQHYLNLGYDAIHAVKQTCLTELSCGGDIRVYDILEGKLSVIKAGSE